MKLQNDEFKRFKELEKKIKSKKCTEAEKQEYNELLAKKKDTKGDKSEFKPGNDFAWWNKIPELTRDSANFKCNWIPGTAIAPNDVDEVGIGVMAISVDSVCGNSISAVDPVNVWARDLYLRMFQKYRPASGYTASDLGIAILAALEAVKLIATYERIYGIVNRYSKLNVNMPIVEAASLGLTVGTVDYLQGHLSDFRYDLNFLIRKAQRLCIPKDLSVIADAISLFGYEYMDHESIRSQFILFNPREYGVYSDIALTSGGSIEYNVISGLFNFSADNMCVILDTVLSSLLGSDSIQRIFADLVVWFGAESMLQFLPMPEDYVVTPVKSESILHKIHNLETFENPAYRICSAIDATLDAADQAYVNGKHMLYQADDRIVTSLDVTYIPSGATATPSTAVIHGQNAYYMTSSGGGALAVTKGHTLDTAHNEITPDIIVEGAMWKYATSVFADAGTPSMWATVIDSCTFYLIHSINLYTVNGLANTLQNIQGTAVGAATNAGYLACIDWAPLCYYIDANLNISRIFGDYDNICYVSNADLNRIHRTIALSGLETNMTVKQ